MLTEHTRLSALAATDPASLPPDLYSAAVEHVQAGYRAEVVRSAAATIRAARGETIQAEVLEGEREQIIEAEEERFAREDEPALRIEIERTARHELTQTTRRRLQEERPGEILDVFIATEGPAIIAAEEERFAKEEAPRVRRDAESSARAALTGQRREELRAKIREEEDVKALQLAETEERFRARIETIAEKAKRTRRVQLGDLHEGDTITIELGEAFTEEQELNSQQASAGRILRVTMDNPEEGTAYVTGDSWEKGGALQKMHAFPGGSHLELGSALATRPGEDAETPSELALAMTYSVPLRTILNGDDQTLPGYDVKKVLINTEKGPFALLDRPSASSHHDPYGQPRGW